MTDIDLNKLAASVQRLEARNSISELRSRYAWYTARGLKEEVFALFIEEGTFSNFKSPDVPPTIARNKTELRQTLSKMQSGRRVPIITNEVISIDGDRASGTCIMFGIVGDGFGGHYVDEFVRQDGTWLFASRSFHPYWPDFAPSPHRIHP